MVQAGWTESEVDRLPKMAPMALHLGSDCNRFEALLLRISPSHFINIHSSTDVDVRNMFELIVAFPVLHLILSPCYQGMPKWFDSVLHAVHSSRLKLLLLCVLPTCFERFCPFRGWSWRDLFHAKKSTRSAARVDESLLRVAHATHETCQRLWCASFDNALEPCCVEPGENHFFY